MLINVASHPLLPPWPPAQGGPLTEASKVLREELWERLNTRARVFRSYQRLKLFAMRAAVEEKRTNSAASSKPQSKLPEQLVWAKVPGSTNQYGPVPRNMVDGGGKASGAASPAMAAGTPRMTPRGSAAPSPRASTPGSTPPPLAPPSARAPSVSGLNSGTVSSPSPPPAVDDYELSGEVGSYEP